MIDHFLLLKEIKKKDSLKKRRLFKDFYYRMFNKTKLEEECDCSTEQCKEGDKET